MTDPRSRHRRWLIAAVLLAAAALTAALVPMPSAFVEAWYSRGIYPAIQPGLTGLANATAVSSLDVLAAAVMLALAAAVYRVARAPRGTRWRLFWLFEVRACAIAAALYLAFLALWGLNYQRVPLAQQLDFESSRVTADAVRRLAFVAIEEANALRGEWGVLPDVPLGQLATTLARPFGEAVAALGLPAGVRPGRPKTPLLAWYLRAAGVSGMTNPFGLETLLPGNLLPHERPMVLAHEWAHLAGLGSEAEASVAAFLTCQRAGELPRYSAWLSVAMRAVSGLDADDRKAALARLSPAVVADIRAARERSRADEVRWLQVAAWDAYDRYLRAHRVPGGIRSYDQVIQLLVGTRFDEGWVPVRAPRAQLGDRQRLPRGLTASQNLSTTSACTPHLRGDSRTETPEAETRSHRSALIRVPTRPPAATMPPMNSGSPTPDSSSAPNAA